MAHNGRFCGAPLLGWPSVKRTPLVRCCNCSRRTPRTLCPSLNTKSFFGQNKSASFSSTNNNNNKETRVLSLLSRKFSPTECRRKSKQPNRSGSPATARRTHSGCRFFSEARHFISCRASCAGLRNVRRPMSSTTSASSRATCTGSKQSCRTTSTLRAATRRARQSGATGMQSMFSTRCVANFAWRVDATHAL